MHDAVTDPTPHSTQARNTAWFLVGNGVPLRVPTRVTIRVTTGVTIRVIL